MNQSQTDTSKVPDATLLVDAERHSEDDLIVAIDAGAEDLTRDENVWEIVSAPGDLQAVRDALAEA